MQKKKVCVYVLHTENVASGETETFQDVGKGGKDVNMYHRHTAS